MNPSIQNSLSHLKFRHLQLITILLELGTLHKAARILNLSQPAVTSMLSDLESTMGVRLFERSHRGVQPTQACFEIVDSLQTLLNDFKNLSENVDRIRSGKEKFLRVGLVPQVFTTYFPRALSVFRDNGGCAIRTQEGTSKLLLAQLWEGKLDCVIGRLPIDGLPENVDIEALYLEDLYSENISIVTGGDKPDEGHYDSVFKWLASKEWILQRRDSSVRLAFNEAFMRAGVSPPAPVVETSNYIQSLALVSGSNYFTVAPTNAANSYQDNRSVHILEVDLKIAPMTVNCIIRTSSQNNEQVKLLISAFKSVVSEH